MKPILLHLLQCTPHQLEMLTLKHYMFWCEIHATSNEELQSLMANTALFKWWFIQYKALQNQFIANVLPYANTASKNALETVYKEHTKNIQFKYSKPLLTQAHKNHHKVLGNPQYN